MGSFEKSKRSGFFWVLKRVDKRDTGGEKVEKAKDVVIFVNTDPHGNAGVQPSIARLEFILFF